MIPLAKPFLDARESEAAGAVVLSGWLSQGPEVAAFETEFAQLVGAPHAVAVANCTVGLHLALLAVGVGPGDEVVTVSHSFLATANAIRYCRAVPVFVDVDPGTFNMDPNAVANAITPRTRAILCVHQIGMPCDLVRLKAIADAHGLALVEDAACAIGSEIRMEGQWQRIGRPVGDVAAFSFHPRKVITTGEGGMLTTRHAEMDAKFRLWRQHSMNVSDRVRHSAATVVFESYPELGYNYRMTDIQAAVGRQQIRRLPEIIEHRRALADAYRRKIAAVSPEVGLPVEPDWARSNWQSFCVRLPAGADQRAVMQRMLDGGVATRRGVMCAHREEACRDVHRRHPLVNSERAQEGCILLPLYTQMTEGEQDQVVEALRAALVKAPA
ncbi:MAG TPA: DegT/DnrJ/EryC1/StrS family aminotransferase [Azospirillaceae bacterium]|nr:DegT/DnrJ/EryC1/StrS family aminotransferase [Azospirillaceae bacterium]